MDPESLNLSDLRYLVAEDSLEDENTDLDLESSFPTVIRLR